MAKSMSIGRNPLNRAAGFTLLELMVALVILALLSGSIFSVVRGAMGEASALQESQSRAQQISGLIELCRSSFRKLPFQATLEGRVRSAQGKALPELIFRNCPQLWAWDPVRALDIVTVVGLRPQVDGLYSLSLLRIRDPDPFRDPIPGSNDQDWVTLIPNIKKLSWRYYDSQEGRWLETLRQGAARPAAIELQILLAEETTSKSFVFWIPALQHPSLSPSPAQEAP